MIMDVWYKDVDVEKLLKPSQLDGWASFADQNETDVDAILAKANAWLEKNSLPYRMAELRIVSDIWVWRLSSNLAISL